MDDEQLRRIARDLINTAIDNAMDKIFKEEMTGDIDQGVDDIVKLTIGQSVTAIRDGKTSPTDDKMKEWVGHFDKELSDKVELTIGQSDTAIRDGQTSPSDKKMEGLFKTTPEEMAGDLDMGVDDIVKLTIGQSVTAIRDGKTSPTDDKMKEWVGHFDKELRDKVALTIRQSDTAICDGQTSPSDKTIEGLFKTTSEVPTITTGSNSPEVSYAGINQEVAGSGSDHLLQITTAIIQADETMTTRQFSETSGKKNVLGRLFDILFKRNKNGAKKIVTAREGGSSGTSVDGQTTCSSKARSKKDWIRRNLLCCFVRQTAKAGGKYQ
ncbi:uncharacterized protein LOC132548555 [Ylistrum balloti]|uniref:uncharacterized protein LOC132548555 n=1 Tax=Ylistrum balloti TaxID=509963 RepID=UPI002905DBCB|nr:uncharacterized protein LOC132548555 [Ylistrum balloti]